MNSVAYTRSDLTRYQRSEIRRLEREGWTVGRIIRLANEDNPWATIELSKGDYSTKAGFPTTKAYELWLTGE